MSHSPLSPPKLPDGVEKGWATNIVLTMFKVHHAQISDLLRKVGKWANKLIVKDHLDFKLR